MAETWGNAFTKQYGENPSAEWGRKLSEYSEEQITRGYDQAVDAGLDYCPNLSTLVGYIIGAGEELFVSGQQALQSRTWEEIQATPMIDKGEGQFQIAHGTAEDAAKNPSDWFAEMNKGL